MLVTIVLTVWNLRLRNKEHFDVTTQLEDVRERMGPGHLRLKFFLLYRVTY